MTITLRKGWRSAWTVACLI